MNEQERLKELDSYRVIDTPPEEYLDELVELASVIFDTPISLITVIGEQREWYKAVRGLDTQSNEKSNSFCQHTFQNPKEVLIVNDTLKDPRFVNNPLVLGQPKIRFYAGAPLETPKGHVLGTLCVIDTKPRKISKQQIRALKLLADKAMEHLNVRKKFYSRDQEIYSYTEQVLGLTNEIPGVLYQFRINSRGAMSFDFFSDGVNEMLPGIKTEELKNVPLLLSKYVHKDDIPLILQGIETSFKNLTSWEAQFRILKNDRTVEWHMGKAQPKRQADGSVVWCGFFHNIMRYKEYERKLKQIAFDISHVIRKPVTTLLGLTSLIEEEQLSKKKIRECLGYIREVSEELDHLTIELDETYRQNIQNSF